MSDHLYDVVVIGGGPSGSATGYWLAEAGHDVCVVERKVFPRDKTCGDGLTPRAVKQLTDMGLAEPLEMFHRYNGLSRVSAGLEGEFQFRRSSEFDEPTLGAFARFNADGFESDLRDGYRVSMGFNVRQALTDRIGFFGALSRNLRSASSRSRRRYS